MYRITILLALLSYFMISCDASKKSDANEIQKSKVIDDGLDSFFLEGLEMSLRLPENWTTERAGAAFIFKDSCSQNFCSNLIVSSKSNQNNLNTEQVAQAFIASLDQRFNEVKVLGVTDEVINDLQFKLIDYKMYEQNTHLGGTTAFMIKGDKVVSFNFMAENRPEGVYPDRRKIFLQILSSIKS